LIFYVYSEHFNYTCVKSQKYNKFNLKNLIGFNVFLF
jgi:hypothetical protein